MSPLTGLLCLLAVQAALMLLDELACHRRRDLPRWERWGHPLDTLSALAPFAVMALTSPGPVSRLVVLALMAFSCAFVTKDEWVHARRCGGLEGWLHSVLFMLHPAIFALAWSVWRGAGDPVLAGVALALAAYAAYQALYWNLLAPPLAARRVDNTIYEQYGERWYDAHDDPVALLRAEARTKNPWALAAIRRRFPDRDPATITVLDLGCGAGFLANDLARAGLRVTGVDLSPDSLAVARAHDSTGTVDYRVADALALPFPDASVDVVACMDLLEHVEDPSALVREAARVLRPGGLFLVHTFNRTWLADLVVIRGVAWFVKSTPPDMHVLRLFVTPEELAGYCRDAGLDPPVLCGIAPDPRRLAFWRMLWTREVPDDFTFRLVRGTRIAYLGHATRRE